MKKIAIITSGGDAPGMNAAIRAVVRQAVYKGIEVVGINRGFIGLLEDDFTRLEARSVSGIINKGGTILRTGRCAEIRTAPGLHRGVEVLKQLCIEGLIIIGGDGSLSAGHAISKLGIPVVCIPASIDNDIYGTTETIGFDTAFNTAVEAIDKIRDTAASHDRIFIVEVMGREHGFLALSVGLAAGAEYIFIPERKTNYRELFADIRNSRERGKTSVIIVFAEGAGNPYDLAKKIERETASEVRVSSLGYIQRGGAPSGRSRVLASAFGSYALDLLASGKKNRLVVFDKDKVGDIPIPIAVKNKKRLNFELYNMAKRLSK